MYLFYYYYVFLVKKMFLYMSFFKIKYILGLVYYFESELYKIGGNC